MKNFVKVLKSNGTAINFLKTKFPRISDANIKEGIFIGPQITQLLRDQNFHNTLSQDKLDAWLSFGDLCTSFFGNKKIPLKILENNEKINVHMSLKI